jgi:CubicO group peptidase (beta-lactamase class C family)
MKLKPWTIRRNGLISLAVVISCTLFITAAQAETGNLSTRQAGVSLVKPDEARGLGWRPEGLERLFKYAAGLSTDALAIVSQGQLVGSLGNLEGVHNLHSMRKAMLSAVVGQHLGEGPGQIPLNATLEQLGIDDRPRPLTPLQRQATVLHLLKSVSGINHRAAAEGGLRAGINRRLGSGENQPGVIWAYNNWDYNALTSIFEKRTALTVAEAFESGIAAPLGMQDFGPASVYYRAAPDRSRHRAAMFRMSARDLLRFGQLYLDQGKAAGRQILPRAWVERITKDYTETGIKGLRAGHGYLWWVPDQSSGLPEGSYFAWGLGQQMLLIIPQWNTVVLHLADMTQFLKRWLALQQKGLSGEAALEKLFASCLSPKTADRVFCAEHRFISRRELNRLVTLLVKARRH